ncbi:MAG: hypothetical protein LBJ77_00460 [Holosporales bacterium]|nr:hypothetical protein [Holosporales bacterium]
MNKSKLRLLLGSVLAAVPFSDVSQVAACEPGVYGNVWLGLHLQSMKAKIDQKASEKVIKDLFSPVLKVFTDADAKQKQAEATRTKLNTGFSEKFGKYLGLVFGRLDGISDELFPGDGGDIKPSSLAAMALVSKFVVVPDEDGDSDPAELKKAPIVRALVLMQQLDSEAFKTKEFTEPFNPDTFDFAKFVPIINKAQDEGRYDELCTITGKSSKQYQALPAHAIIGGDATVIDTTQIFGADDEYYKDVKLKAAEFKAAKDEVAAALTLFSSKLGTSTPAAIVAAFFKGGDKKTPETDPAIVVASLEAYPAKSVDDYQKEFGFTPTKNTVSKRNAVMSIGLGIGAQNRSGCCIFGIEGRGSIFVGGPIKVGKTDQVKVQERWRFEVFGKLGYMITDSAALYALIGPAIKHVNVDTTPFGKQFVEASDALKVGVVEYNKTAAGKANPIDEALFNVDYSKTYGKSHKNAITVVCGIGTLINLCPGTGIVVEATFSPPRSVGTVAKCGADIKHSDYAFRVGLCQKLG